MKTQKNNKTTKQHPVEDVNFHDKYQIRQNSRYNKNGKAAPDNNIFWEERSNPLSSKGN